MVKKILLLFLLVSGVYIYAESNLHNEINNGVAELVPTANKVNQKIDYAKIAKEIQVWIFFFVGLIAVCYIVYIGAKLLWAPGSSEEMTKSLVSLSYVVIGLALMPFAYFLINFIINIRI